ncbi:MAG: TIGR02099 family protein [Xanthomonadales bacterium]|nr:TIGR02099 family protein [Xanthomonadales bacterium]
MTPFRRRLRKLRFFVQAAFVTLVISAAVIVAIAQLALPWLADNPRRIEGWLSERLHRQVTIGQLSGQWTRAGPRLIFNDLRIRASDSGEAELRLPRSELAINLFAAFQKNLAWNEFRVVGLDLALNRAADGQWKLRGLDLDESADGDTSMGSLGVVVLVDMKLAVRAPSHAIDLDLRIPELRVVNRGRITRVLGQVGTANSASSPLSLVADIDVGDRSGHLYLGARDLDIGELTGTHAPGGITVVTAKGDLQLWASWQAGQLNETQLKLALGQTILQANTEIKVDEKVAVLPRSAFDHLALSARWQRQQTGWRFDLADFSAGSDNPAGPVGRLVAEYASAEPASTHVRASTLELGSLGTLAMLSDAVPARLRHWLYLANPQCAVDALDLRWSSVEEFDVDARVSRFSSRPAAAIPGIDGLAAHLRGDGQAVWLEVPEQQTRIDYPMVFRKPFEFTRFGGDVVAWPDDEGWSVRSHRFDLVGDGFAASLRGGAGIPRDRTRPSLDLYADISDANVDAAKLFWPVNVMPATTVEWLDRALDAGQITQGRALVRGDLDSWPFNDNAGRFEARAELSGLKLDFLPDWPSGESLDASARFINNGMQVSAREGTSMAISLDEAEATIADFHEPVLELSVDAHANGKDLLGYLRATPVGADHVDYLRGLGIGGKGVAHIDLDVPLKHHEDLTLDGYVDLSAANLDETTWDLHFTDASGRVRFGRNGVLADALETHFDGLPVNLAIAIGSSAKDPDNSFEASLRGVLPAAVAFAKATDLAPAMANFPGQAEWNIDLAIGSESGAAKGRKALHLQSDLEGIAINLPAPLGKSADLRLPFTLNLEMPLIGQPFSASLGDILQIGGRLPGPDTPLAARLDLGPAASTKELPASGMAIAGHAKTFDVGGWIGLFTAGGGGSELLRGIDIDVDELLMAGRSFPNLHLALTPDGETMKIDVAGDSLQGDLSVPSVDLRRRGITAQMQRVHWPEPLPGNDGAAAALADVAPASIPPLHLWIGQLQLGATNLGELRLESSPDGDAMRIDLLETKSAAVNLHASGAWSGTAGDNHSRMVVELTAESLGSMLDTFGFAGIIEGGQTIAHIDASWPGSPTAFVLANMNGSLDVSVQEGRILDVEPGAGGRLFGLLSLREIPRRLSLDFSDLFKSGMSFNSIKGSFALADGNARTSNLHIASPAADITISGRTGLRDKDYDQEMIVTPRAGVALPVVGALAGGPVGAAAGLVVQTLIGKRINRAARSRYQVSGSWDKPQITLIGKDSVRLDEDEATTLEGIGSGAAASAAERAAMPDDPVQAVIDAIPGARVAPAKRGDRLPAKANPPSVSGSDNARKSSPISP